MKRSRAGRRISPPGQDGPRAKLTGDEKVSGDLEKDVAGLKDVLGASDDIIFREFRLCGNGQLVATLVYVDGMVDKDLVQRDVIRPLMHLCSSLSGKSLISAEELSRIVQEELVNIQEIKESDTYQAAIDGLLNGDPALFVDGMTVALNAGLRNWEHRTISEPSTEQVIRGPREGFNELLKTNITLIRRKLKDPNLSVKLLKLGERSQTDIAVLYHAEITNESLVKEVFRRLNKIEISAILDSGYIEQYLQDNPWSPFPQVQYTERPDRVASALLEGRVAILADGSPFALLAPATLPTFLPAPDDYYDSWIVVTAIRLFRTISIFNSSLLPSIYVSLLNFHHEMIPVRLSLAMATARSGVPFPAVVEALIMEVTFELLREAGVRLPTAIGQTIGIVGGIIIGQAAVSARIVSPLTVIIVALTAIGSFSIPAVNMATSLRLLRFPLLLLAATFGFYGVLAGLILIYLHLVTLKSFGVPYMSPVSPFSLATLNDTIVRAPLWRMRWRPRFFAPRDPDRLAPRPAPGRKGGRNQ
ncbi:MAG: spore germination protein [Bacillota bacterium]